MTIVRSGVVLLAGACFVGGTTQFSGERQVVQSMLDAYERTGQTGSVTFRSVNSLTSALDDVVPRWVASAPHGDGNRRQKLAALLVLEMAMAGPFVDEHAKMIDWADGLLHRAPRDDFARRWVIAAAARLEEDRALQVSGYSGLLAGYLDRSMTRFPEDKRLSLVRVLMRPELTMLSTRPGADLDRLTMDVQRRGMPTAAGPEAAGQIQRSIRDLVGLTDDPVVGPEARTHLALLYFHLNRLSDCLRESAHAARQARDPFVRSLAWIAAGIALDAQGRFEDATEAYRSAVEALPARSAATALAVHLFLTGNREEASAALERAFRTGPLPVDPWVQVIANYRFLPMYLAELRAAVGLETVNPLATRSGFPASRPVAQPVERRESDRATTESSSLQPIFRASTNAVVVDVSVRRGRVPVPDLAASDFRVFDNSVLQTVDSVEKESMPLDVSIVVDLLDHIPPLGRGRGATDAWRMEQSLYKSDVRQIGHAMTPQDRVRLVTFEGTISEVVPLQRAGIELPVDNWFRGPLASRSYAFGRPAGPFFDAVASTLFRATPPGRRHLVFAFSDGVDDASLVSPDILLAAARQADVVLYLSQIKTWEEFQREAGRVRPTPWLVPLWDGDPGIARELAVATDGRQLYYDGATVGDVTRILNDFRTRYVLRYTARGVPPNGWHDIEVRVTRPGNFNVEARKGYFGG